MDYIYIKVNTLWVGKKNHEQSCENDIQAQRSYGFSDSSDSSNKDMQENILWYLLY